MAVQGSHLVRAKAQRAKLRRSHFAQASMCVDLTEFFPDGALGHKSACVPDKMLKEMKKSKFVCPLCGLHCAFQAQLDAHHILCSMKRDVEGDLHG